MAYRDPYTTGYGNNYNETFNPYESSGRQPYGSYDPSGYGNYGNYSRSGYRDDVDADTSRYDQYTRGDEYYNQTPQRQATQRTHKANALGFSSDDQASTSGSGFDRGEFAAAEPKGEKGGIRGSLYDSKDSLWTKGGAAKCCGRFICCTILIGLLLIISILGALALWIRPPSIDVGDPKPQGSGSNAFQLSREGLKVNLGVDINVVNPNYFSVNFDNIKAELFYPVDNLAIGGGSANNVQFPSNSKKDYTFPFNIDYKLADDPQSNVLKDIIAKCSGNGSQLKINYKITVQVKILFIPVSPVVQNSVNFDCPFTASDIASILGGGGASGILGG